MTQQKDALEIQREQHRAKVNSLNDKLRSQSLKIEELQNKLAEAKESLEKERKEIWILRNDLTRAFLELSELKAKYLIIP